jgi:hypothetical protein
MNQTFNNITLLGKLNFSDGTFVDSVATSPFPNTAAIQRNGIQQTTQILQDQFIVNNDIHCGTLVDVPTVRVQNIQFSNDLDNLSVPRFQNIAFTDSLKQDLTDTKNDLTSLISDHFDRPTKRIRLEGSYIGNSSFSIPSSTNYSFTNSNSAITFGTTGITFTGNVSGITKSMVGLGNVDNTSDLNKPVSTATTTALALKANLAGPTNYTNTHSFQKVNVRSTGSASNEILSVGSSTNTGFFMGVMESNGAFMSGTTTGDSCIISRGPYVDAINNGTGNSTLILGNWGRNTGVSFMMKNRESTSGVDEGSEIRMLMKSLTKETRFTQTLDGFTFLGNVSGISKSMVGLSNVENTSDLSKPVSTATQSALDLKANLASPTFTGTVSGITKNMVGLSNVENTSDLSKPVSTATQSALDLKANLASPTFTGTVSGISKSMVGLGNVENTSDADKPVSTATTTALALKANLASPTFTGTVSVGSGGILFSDLTTQFTAYTNVKDAKLLYLNDNRLFSNILSTTLEQSVAKTISNGLTLAAGTYHFVCNVTLDIQTAAVTVGACQLAFSTSNNGFSQEIKILYQNFLNQTYPVGKLANLNYSCVHTFPTSTVVYIVVQVAHGTADRIRFNSTLSDMRAYKIL